MRRMCYAEWFRAFMSGGRGLNTTVANGMPRHRTRSLIALGLAATMLALSGCSAAQQIPYPKFSGVKRVTKKLLTREEKEAAIEEMTLERNKQRAQTGEPGEQR